MELTFVDYHAILRNRINDVPKVIFSADIEQARQELSDIKVICDFMLNIVDNIEKEWKG